MVAASIAIDAQAILSPLPAPAIPDPDAAIIEAYWRLVHPEQPAGFVPAALAKNGAPQLCLRDETGDTDYEGWVETAVKRLARDAQRGDVYSTHSTLLAQPVSGRGTAAAVATVTGIVLDLDIVTPGHHKQTTGLPIFPDVDTALRVAGNALHGLGDPTFIVHSGGGLQLHLLFERPIVIADEAQRREMQGVFSRFHKAVAEAVAWEGFHLDATHDLVRLHRVPGSINWKATYRGEGPAKPVTVLGGTLPTRDRAALYTLEELAEHAARLGVPAIPSKPEPRAEPITGRGSRQGCTLADEEVEVIVSAFAANWTAGNRHAASVSLSGYLAKKGVPREQAERIVSGIVERTGDEEADSRLRDVGTSYDRFEAGQSVSGFDGLEQVFGESFDAWFGPIENILDEPVLPDTSALPEFPLDVLPDDIRQYVEASASSFPIPAGMVASPLLAGAAAVMGNGWQVCVKTGWIERAIIWSVAVAPPGSAKTPSANLGLVGLDAVEDELQRRFEHELAEWQIREAERKQAVKRGEPGREAETPEPRPLHRTVRTNDATKEALLDLLGHNTGLLFVRDELAALIASFDAYRGGKGGDRQDFMSLYSGPKRWATNRKSSGLAVAIRPTVSIFGGIQPDRLGDMVDDLAEDGFIDRFLWNYHPDLAPNGLRLDDIEDFDRLRAEVERVFLQLLRERGAEPVELVLSEAARLLVLKWDAMLMEEMRKSPSPIRAMLAKLRGTVFRLALVLQGLHHPDGGETVISGEMMAKAIALAEFYRAHNTAAIQHLRWLKQKSGKAVREAKTATVESRLLDALDDGGEWMSRSDLNNATSRNISADERQRVLDKLVADGRVERRKEPTAKGSSDRYRLKR